MGKSKKTTTTPNMAKLDTSRDTIQVQIELPIDLYNFFHDYLAMQTITLDQLIAREMIDSARRILKELSDAWFDRKAVARKYHLSELVDSTPQPESPTSESVLKRSGGE